MNKKYFLEIYLVIMRTGPRQILINPLLSPISMTGIGAGILNRLKPGEKKGMSITFNWLTKSVNLKVWKNRMPHQLKKV